jgi:hypothetical protein
LTRKVFLDCEFIPEELELEGLLSIGMVDNMGNEYYAINSEANTWKASPFVKANVLPFFDTPESYNHIRNTFDIREGVQNFFEGFDRNDTIVYAWCGSQDMVRLHSLWNHDWYAMPGCIPHWFQDIKGLLQIYQMTEDVLPVQDAKTQHHALYDAKYDKACYDVIMHNIYDTLEALRGHA